jgi:hypothetical protein
MRKFNQFEVLEEKVRLMTDGFRSPEFPQTPLGFRGEELLPMQVAQRLQGILDGFQGVRDAEAAHRLARAELERAVPHHAAFYAEAVEVVKAHFGTDPRRLASFGLELFRKPRKHHRRGRPEREVVTTTVVEEVTLGRGRRPEVEVLETDSEVVEVIEPPARRHRHGTRGGVRRAAGAPVDPGATVTLPSTVNPRGVGSLGRKRSAGR